MKKLKNNRTYLSSLISIYSLACLVITVALALIGSSSSMLLLLPPPPPPPGNARKLHARCSSREDRWMGNLANR